MIAQRLVRRMCDKCREQITPEPKIAEMIKKELEAVPEITKKDLGDILNKEIKIWEAKGCKFCSNKGSKGRVAIFEVLNMTPDFEKIIVEGPTEAKLVIEAQRQGMITMKQDGFLKVIEGIVSLEEVLGAVEQ